MPGFVKTKADEKKWQKAKRAARHAGADNTYAFSNWWFHHVRPKRRRRKRG